MTRFCIRCTRILGETCVHCGAEATPLKTNSNGNAMAGTEFDCDSCGHHFKQGEGGETGGMCERCLDSFLRQGDRIGSEKPNMRGEANDNQQG